MRGGPVMCSAMRPVAPTTRSGLVSRLPERYEVVMVGEDQTLRQPEAL